MGQQGSIEPVKCVESLKFIEVAGMTVEGFGECTIGPETGQVHIADLFGKLGHEIEGTVTG